MSRIKKRILGTICSALAIACVGGYAYAQAPSLPGSADPARLQERLLVPNAPAQGQIISPDSQSIDEVIPEAPDGFILTGVELQGVTAFAEGHFTPLINEYVNRPVDITVLNHLSARITQAYRDEGFFLSRALIPEQEVTDGRVIIKVIEGQIGHVIIDDPQNLLARDQLGIVNKTITLIKKSYPLHGPTLERYILLLNDYMGLSIQNILQPPTTPSAPGTADITLRVREKTKQSASILYNNHGSRFVGPHQFTANYARSGVFNSFDQLGVQTSTAVPFSEVQFGSLNYRLPLNEAGLTASVLMSYSNSEPGYTLRALEVEGDSTIFTTSLTYPLIRSRRENLILGTAFSVRNSATEFLDQELIDDKTRTLSIFANYDTQDRWNGFTNIDLSVSKGLDVFDATKTGSNNLSRQQGRSDFIKTTLNATRQQEIVPYVQMINSVSAQYAPHPLLSSEEFGYGGASLGRAYDPSEITGDRGVSGSVEILYTDVDPVPIVNLKFVPFIFYDIGKVWNSDRGAKPQSAASAGFGTHYDFNQTLSGSFQIAYPLTKSVDNPVMDIKSGPRVLFNVSYGF